MTKLDLSCSGIPEEFSALVNAHLEGASRALDLAVDFRHIEICADDLSGQDGAWFRFQPPTAGSESRARVTLYCSAEVFCRPRSASTGIFPGVEIWEQHPAQSREAGSDPGEFSGSAADCFLYHNLLLVQDIFLERLDLSNVPDSQAQAFASAWSATIDGRLARRGLPGYSLAFRRNRFSGLFSPAGILLPGHWEIFQSLWDGAMTTASEVLSASRQLPRL